MILGTSNMKHMAVRFQNFDGKKIRNCDLFNEYKRKCNNFIQQHNQETVLAIPAKR